MSSKMQLWPPWHRQLTWLGEYSLTRPCLAAESFWSPYYCGRVSLKEQKPQNYFLSVRPTMEMSHSGVNGKKQYSHTKDNDHIMFFKSVSSLKCQKMTIFRHIIRNNTGHATVSVPSAIHLGYVCGLRFKGCNVLQSGSICIVLVWKPQQQCGN